ncbi:MAG TPA: hypothetical protein VFH50_11630 [Acidimicrobiales bacterium]|nr:hypothetical protein [Acidimicrobiales bacterium]
MGDPVAHFWAASQLDVDAMRGGDFELADECQAILDELSARLQQPTLVWNALSHAAAHAMGRGDPARAEELAGRALDLAMASGQPDAFGYYGSQLMTVRRQQGRMGELLSLIADVAERNPLPIYRSTLATAYLQGGDREAALRMIEAEEATGFAFQMDSAWLDGMLSYAIVADELDLPGPAEKLFDLLAPYHDLIPASGLNVRDPIAVTLGALSSVLGRYEEAERHFAFAAEVAARGEMAHAEALTRLLWGRMLRRQDAVDERVRARELLESARSAAEQRGYGSITRRAQEEISGLG